MPPSTVAGHPIFVVVVALSGIYGISHVYIHLYFTILVAIEEKNKINLTRWTKGNNITSSQLQRRFEKSLANAADDDKVY